MSERYNLTPAVKGVGMLGPVGRSKSVPPEVIGQRKCPHQLFRRSVAEAGWQQAGWVSE